LQIAKIENVQKMYGRVFRSYRSSWQRGSVV